MILQTQSSVLCDLMATDGGDAPHLDAYRDALRLAQATAQILPSSHTVSNDRTTLPHQIGHKPK